MFYYIDYEAVPSLKFYCIGNKLEEIPNGWKEVTKKEFYDLMLETYKKNKNSLLNNGVVR